MVHCAGWQLVSDKGCTPRRLPDSKIVSMNAYHELAAIARRAENIQHSALTPECNMKLAECYSGMAP
jgi:hypothetical protein